MKSVTTAYIKVISALAATALIAGCAGTGKKASENSIADYAAGNYSQAARNLELDLGFFDEETGGYFPVVPVEDRVLLQLEAAEASRLSGMGDRAVAHYDAVEELFRVEDTESIGESAAENVGAVAINDNLMSYKPTPVERVLANYYKALTFWAGGDTNNARVEFNRAGERAERALARYQAEIEAAEQEAQEEVGSGVTMLSSDSVTAEHFPEIARYSVYPDFENPAVQYAQAMFYASQGENSRARDAMRQARIKVGEHPVLDDDLLKLDAQNSLKADGNYAWVLVEAGQSAYLKEKRIDLPIPGPNGGIILMSMALPLVEDRPLEFSRGAITLDGNQLAFESIADSRRLIETEMSRRFPAIMTRAIASTTAKALLQYVAADQGGWMGNLAATAFTSATTSADVRMWEMIPNQWLLAKVRLDESADAMLEYGVQSRQTIALEKGSSWFVVVKQPTPLAEPFVSAYKI